MKYTFGDTVGALAPANVEAARVELASARMVAASKWGQMSGVSA